MSGIKQKSKNRGTLFQGGMTLLEVMVGVILGAFVMLGLFQIYLNNKQSIETGNHLASLSDSARYTLNMLATDINMAGFVRNELGAPDPFDVINTKDNEIENTDLGFLVGNLRASDTLSVRYESDKDCLGNDPAGPYVVNEYYLNGTDLVCKGQGSDETGLIAKGIENIQFLYGVDSTGDEVANMFVNAENVSNWHDVVAVRVSILVNGGRLPGSNISGVSYALLNIPKIGPFDDGNLRREFTRTVNLKNANLK